MSLDNLKLHLSLQKLISIQSYSLPKNERCNKILTVVIRLIPLSFSFSLNIFYFLEILMRHKDNRANIELKTMDHFILFLSFVDIVFLSLGTLLIILFIISRNQRHIQVIESLKNFERIIGNEIRLAAKSRRYLIELLIVALHEYIYIIFSSYYLRDLEFFYKSCMFVSQIILLDITLIYLVHIIRYFWKLLEKYPQNLFYASDFTRYFVISQEAFAFMKLFNFSFQTAIALMILQIVLEIAHGFFIWVCMIFEVEMDPKIFILRIANCIWIVKYLSFILYISQNSSQLHKMV